MGWREERPWEAELMDRLESIGNPVGYKPHSRDEDGNAILRAIIERPGGVRRIAYLKVTKDGLLYDEQELTVT